MTGNKRRWCGREETSRRINALAKRIRRLPPDHEGEAGRDHAYVKGSMALSKEPPIDVLLDRLADHASENHDGFVRVYYGTLREAVSALESAHCEIVDLRVALAKKA